MRKNLWKKATAAVMALGLAVTCLTACSSSSSENTTTPAGDTKEDAGNTTSKFDTSKNITVISREDGSGTRGAFIEIMGIEKKDADGNKVDYTTTDAVITDSTNVMLTTVAGDDYAIGYVSLGSLNDTVKALKVNGVEAKAENVANGSYTVSRPFNIAVKDDSNAAAQDFIKFILSSDGQAVIESNGYVKVSDAAAYEASDITGSIVVGGSSSVGPVMEKLAEAYKAVSKVDVELQITDSTTGMTSAADGTYDIGMASRELKDSEKESLTGTVIAMDGIAVIVNNNNSLEDIKTETVGSIFMGEVKTWADAQ